MKPSGMIQRENRAYLKGMADGKNFMRQLMFDLSCIALNETEGFGYDRISRFADKLIALHDEYAIIFNGDTKDQEYSKSVLDRRLQQIAGERFIPWEERYDG